MEQHVKVDLAAQGWCVRPIPCRREVQARRLPGLQPGSLQLAARVPGAPGDVRTAHLLAAGGGDALQCANGSARARV